MGLQCLLKGKSWERKVVYRVWGICDYILCLFLGPWIVQGLEGGQWNATVFCFFSSCSSPYSSLLHMYMCLLVLQFRHDIVMMCKMMMRSHPLSPGGSQPLPSDAPSHTFACASVSSQSGWRLLTPLSTAGRLPSFISALMTYKGTVTF